MPNRRNSQSRAGIQADRKLRAAIICASHTQTRPARGEFTPRGSSDLLQMERLEPICLTWRNDLGKT
jgi:hypothetical protein